MKYYSTFKGPSRDMIEVILLLSLLEKAEVADTTRINQADFKMIRFFLDSIWIGYHRYKVISICSLEVLHKCYKFPLFITQNSPVRKNAFHGTYS